MCFNVQSNDNDRDLLVDCKAPSYYLPVYMHFYYIIFIVEEEEEEEQQLEMGTVTLHCMPSSYYLLHSGMDGRRAFYSSNGWRFRI